MEAVARDLCDGGVRVRSGGYSHARPVWSRRPWDERWWRPREACATVAVVQWVALVDTWGSSFSGGCDRRGLEAMAIVWGTSSSGCCTRLERAGDGCTRRERTSYMSGSSTKRYWSHSVREASPDVRILRWLSEKLTGNPARIYAIYVTIYTQNQCFYVQTWSVTHVH
jgi:hypothetical protein